MSLKRGAMPRAYKSKPTEKQIKAITAIQNGSSAYSAMKQAGYSAKTARHPGKNLLRQRGVINYLEEMKKEYTIAGITPKYLIAKTQEWMEATYRNGSADYQTQLKAAAFIRKDFGLETDTNPNTAIQINNYSDHSQTQKDKYKI